MLLLRSLKPVFAPTPINMPRLTALLAALYPRSFSTKPSHLKNGRDPAVVPKLRDPSGGWPTKHTTHEKTRNLQGWRFAWQMRLWFGLIGVFRGLKIRILNYLVLPALAALWPSAQKSSGSRPILIG